MLHFRHIIFAVILLPSTLCACLNDSYRTAIPLVGGKIDLHALLQRKQGVAAYWTTGYTGDVYIAMAIDSMQKVGLNNLDDRGKSDYAALVLRVGDRVEALRIFEQLYTAHPDDYTIVANLGTAYEVTGNNAKALELLRKAVAIDPRSHYGSEWIHIRILEEKLGAKQYDKIIGLGIQDYGKWIVDKQYTFVRNPDSLKFQIAYQLHERIGFIAPTDPIVGQLVLDFADIVAKTDTRQEAVPFYDYAATYEPGLKTTVDARKVAIKTEQQEVVGTFRWASVVWALPLLAFFAILFSWMKAIRKQKNADGQQR